MNPNTVRVEDNKLYFFLFSFLFYFIFYFLDLELKVSMTSYMTVTKCHMA